MRLRSPSVSSLLRRWTRLLPQPLLLQRQKMYESCEVSFSKRHVDVMNAEIFEDRCTGAYTCPFEGSWGKSGIGEITNCLGSKSPATHFGRRPVPLTGKLVGADEDLFAEFLSSIMGNEKLFRTYVDENGAKKQNSFSTDSYIDDSTEEVHLLLVFLAHDMGALSIVKVSIEFGASVSADYTIDHLASVEGANLSRFQIFGAVHLVALIPFILSSLAAVFYGDYRRAAFNLAVLRIWSPTRSCSSRE